VKRAISNLAWNAAEADDVYTLLQRYNITGMEVVPGKLFEAELDPYLPSIEKIEAAQAVFSGLGIQLVSMQSLLYAKPEAQLFGTKVQQSIFYSEMKVAINLASRLSIPNIVFGSPANRNITHHFSPLEAEERAVTIFRGLGDHAQSQGVVISIEPNPREYGSNFLTDTGSAAAFVRLVDHDAVKLNFDLGAITMNNEMVNFERIFESAFDVISHIHISEPNLASAPRDTQQISRLKNMIDTFEYTNWVSIEMKRPSENTLVEIERSLEIFVK
jgi:sugar phosphate isomerase/epimerase